MKRRLFAGLGALLLAVLLVTPAAAITGTYVEDNEHPFVGLAVFYDANGEFLWRCSGSLLTPTVFLTAGHCTDLGEGAVTARVYFQQDAGVNYDPATQLDPVSGYPEYCADGTLGVTCATSDEIYSYGFDNFAGFPNHRDVGLIILDQPISLSEYGQLASAGTLDVLATQRGLQDVTFAVSGYGVTYKDPVHTLSYRERLMATSKLVNITSAQNAGFNLQTSGNGGGRGGTCSGDSGGPVFYPADTNIIVGVTSFGLNAWCRGSDFAYRTDQQAVIDWILATVPESEASKIVIV